MARNTPLDISSQGVISEYVESKTITLDGNNATKAHKLFAITGAVRIKALYGVVQQALGSNLTAAHWRINDQTVTVAVSLATGTTISSLAIGSLLVRKSVASVALTADNASAAKVVDPVAATATDVFMPFNIVQKTGGVATELEFVYTTTSTPTSGEIKFYVEFEPLTPDADVRAV